MYSRGVHEVELLASEFEQYRPPQRYVSANSYDSRPLSPSYPAGDPFGGHRGGSSYSPSYQGGYYPAYHPPSGAHSVSPYPSWSTPTYPSRPAAVYPSRPAYPSPSYPPRDYGHHSSYVPTYPSAPAGYPSHSTSPYPVVHPHDPTPAYHDTHPSRPAVPGYHDTHPSRPAVPGYHDPHPSHPAGPAHHDTHPSHPAAPGHHDTHPSHPHVDPHGHGSHPAGAHDSDNDSDGAASAHHETIDLHKAKKARNASKKGSSGAPGSGGQLPIALYHLPADLWSGLHMNGQFVAQSDVGPIPLIITTPHDGKMTSNYPQRPAGIKMPDMHTMEIALAAYQEVKRQLGAPTIVAQLLQRKWVDCNRGTPNDPHDSAYTSTDGEHAYWTWHHAIQDTIVELRKRGFNPFLVDIHGSANVKNKGHIDCAYGGTSAKFLPGLKKTYGPDAIQKLMWTGPGALLQELENNGLPVHKPKNVFSGGFTSTHYAEVVGINTMQIEFDTVYRQADTAPEVGRKVGAALATFLKHYPMKQ